MKTYINQLQLRGFKSFNRKVQLAFCPGLNCVIGPNGSGKSNVSDSICFLLGRLSSKDLRAENFAELLFKRKDVVAAEGEVTICFDNNSNVFPVDSKIIEIKRRIRRNGQTKYKINGKTKTRQEVLELLSHARVHPEGHNIIQQGDISKFVDMRPLEKRMVIEEIAGISVYEERKRKALSELEKIDEKLKEAQIILTEKETYLAGLEKEKEEAEKFRSAREQLQAVQATEIHLRLDSGQSKKNSALADIEKCSKSIDKYKSQLDEINKKLNQLKEQISDLEKVIEQKGGEESLALQKNIESAKDELQKSQALINSSYNEIERIKTRSSQLAQSLEQIQNKIIELEKEKSLREKDRASLLKTEKSLKKKVGLDELNALTSSIEQLEQKIEQLRTQKELLNSNLQNNISEIKLIDSQMSNISEKIKSAEEQEGRIEQLKGAKGEFKKILEEINGISARDSSLALQLGELKKELIKNEEELAREKVHHVSAQEVLLQDRAIKEILSSSIRKTISGILGTVSELGEADPKYATCLKVAAGGRMKNIAVENLDTALKCLNLLKDKKLGIATFLPLDKIKIPEEASAPKQEGVIGLATDLIKTEKKFENLFRFVFRNTLIVADSETARKIGVSSWRMVTLDGDLFELSGAITGGYRLPQIGVEFKSPEKSNKSELEADISRLLKKIKDFEADRCQLEVRLIDLRRQKAELEGKAAAVKGITSDISKEQLESQIKDLKLKSKDLENNSKTIEKEIKKIEEEFGSCSSKRDSLKEELKKLQINSQSKESEELNQKKTEIEASLATFIAQLQNALLPEQENISRVLKELEKERLTFEKQIKLESEKSKKLQADLRDKEKEEKEFFGRLKDLFAKKNKLNEEAKGEEEKIKKTQDSLNQIELEKNTFAVKKAQYEGELAGLQEEFKPFEGVKILEDIKTSEEAKKRVRALSGILEKFGAVNLKALEVYDIIKKEYEALAWKASKLNSEKADVLSVIDEIEKKKTDAFLKVYNEVARNFEQIFLKIMSKHKAMLALENEKAPLEGGVTVQIRDVKGKHMSVAALSGGEKVLVALAFIFAIQEFEPASFYLMDEIDAALDKVNSEKVAKLLKEYSAKAQVIVITHNDAVISEADQIYGVSMTRDGESNIVSLKI